LKIQQELFTQVSKIRDMVKKEAEFNVTSRLELLNVNSQASQTQYQLTTAEGDVGIAELILKQTMNIDPQDDLAVDPNLDFKKVDISYEEAVRAAYKLRPEIRANALLLDYYNLGRKVAKAKGWPKIDLLGSWGLAKEEYTSEDSLGPTSPTGAAGSNGPIYDQDQKLEQQFYAGVKASMPFWGSTGEYSWTREQWVPVVSAYQGTEASTHTFKLKILDRLDYYSERQQSEVEYDRARQELNKTKQEVTLEVKEGCFNYQKALLQLETATNKVKYQAMDLETTQFRRGMDEVQDSNLIDSMTKMAQEKFSYAQALADCHTALASVNKAIGVDTFYKDESDPKR
jgi:outer membrane protein TolC